MAKKFIFIKDVENFLKQAKTEMQLPEGCRLSPAAWDLVREKKIKLSFGANPSPQDVGVENRISQKQSSSKKDFPPQPWLTAIVSAQRGVSGKVGENVATSPYFLIFDHNGKFIDIIKNPFVDRKNDADQMIVNLLAASQVSAVAAQNFSTALSTRLAEKDIQYFEISGPVEEAVKVVLSKKGGDKKAPIKIESINTN